MANILRVRREAYVSSSFSNFFTPDTLLLWMSKYLTSKGFSYTRTSKGIFHIKGPSDDDTSDDENRYPDFLTSKSISDDISDDYLLGKSSSSRMLVDVISFEASGVANITEANEKRELRFEPGKVKGQGVPTGTLRIQEDRQTKLNFKDSTDMFVGTHEDHILWRPSEKSLPDELDLTKFNIGDATNLVLLRTIDQLGSGEEIKSVQPGVFIITWICQDKIFRSRHVQFQSKLGVLGSFEIHPECSYNKLSHRGDAVAGKIDIRDVQDGRLRLVFPLPVSLSITVKTGGEVTLISWRRNDDVKSKNLNEGIFGQKKNGAINQKDDSHGITPDIFSSGAVINIVFNGAVKDFRLFENQTVTANIDGSGSNSTTNVASVTTTPIKHGQQGGDDDGGKNKDEGGKKAPKKTSS